MAPGGLADSRHSRDTVGCVDRIHASCWWASSPHSSSRPLIGQLTMPPVVLTRVSTAPAADSDRFSRIVAPVGVGAQSTWGAVPALESWSPPAGASRGPQRGPSSPLLPPPPLPLPGASYLAGAPLKLWGPVFNIQEKITVNFHTQCALCTCTYTCKYIGAYNMLEWEIQILNK